MNPFFVLGPIILLLAVAPYVTPRPPPISYTPMALEGAPLSGALRREARRAAIWRRALEERTIDSTVDAGR